MPMCRFLGVVLALATSVAMADPQPRVVLVQPSAAVVPANLLRSSITFDVPVEGEVLTRLSLRRMDGSTVDSPFLQQELWSPDGRILTLLLHPGRVKTGLVAREMLGPILVPGDDVILMLDESPIQRWHIGAIDETGPVVEQWRLSTVQEATRMPLVVTLDGPIDGRDSGFLAVADSSGQRVEGQARLVDGENVWVFVPLQPWTAGDYRLVARETLEDPAGNRVGSHFEMPLVADQSATRVHQVTFSVGRLLH